MFRITFLFIWPIKPDNKKKHLLMDWTWQFQIVDPVSFLCFGWVTVYCRTSLSQAAQIAGFISGRNVRVAILIMTDRHFSVEAVCQMTSYLIKCNFIKRSLIH